MPKHVTLSFYCEFLGWLMGLEPTTTGITGYTVEIDYGIGGDSNIVLGDVKNDKFKITAQEGGTVTVCCRMIAHPDEKVIGPLCNFIQRDIVLTITPPEPTTVQELFGEAA